MVEIPKGAHKVTVSFTNYYRRSSRCDHNLRVDRVSFRPSTASSEVDKYSQPITIIKGGTYSGAWQSLDPDVAAVQINTTEPVTIENASIRGRGYLIKGIGHTNVTVRNSYGYGLNPDEAGKSLGRFLVVEEFENVVVENNYLEGTSGIYLRKYLGDGDANQTVKILSNRAKNIDGRHSEGKGSFSQTSYGIAQFIQFNDLKSVPNVEIAWNEVINEPGKSRVEDNISIYLSSGTADSPIRIHDNFIQGAYPTNPKKDGYSGGGIMLGDGSSSTVEGAAAFVTAFRNQVISTTNYGIAIAAGHDNKFYENRIVSSGYLADGSWIAAQNVGAYVWDINDDRKRTPSTYYNNSAYDNVIGWMRKDSSGRIMRNDWWFPNCAKSSDATSLCTGNQGMSDTITRDTEETEFKRWQDKLATAKVAVGPLE